MALGQGRHGGRAAQAVARMAAEALNDLPLAQLAQQGIAARHIDPRPSESGHKLAQATQAQAAQRTVALRLLPGHAQVLAAVGMQHAPELAHVVRQMEQNSLPFPFLLGEAQGMAQESRPRARGGRPGRDAALLAYMASLRHGGGPQSAKVPAQRSGFGFHRVVRTCYASS